MPVLFQVWSLLRNISTKALSQSYCLGKYSPLLIYLIDKTYQKQFAFTWKQLLNTILPQCWYNSKDLCHCLVSRDHDHFTRLEDNIVVYQVDDILLTGPKEQEVVGTLFILVRHMQAKWELNLEKNFGKVSGGPVIWKMLGYSLQWEELASFHYQPHRECNTFFWILETVYSMWRYTIQMYLPGAPEDARF